jgi:biopolymer transport protein ExbB
MQTRLIILALCSASLLTFAQEEDAEKYRKAADSVGQDLRTALDELVTLRNDISKSKPQLAKETNEISAELREAKRLAEIARVTREAAESEFEKNEKELKLWREERMYLEGLLLDFRKNYEASQSLAQIELDRNLLDQSDLDSRLRLVENTIDQLGHAGKVRVFEGEVINTDGILVQGEFADTGPVRWFRSLDGRDSGLLSKSEDLRPRLVKGTEDPMRIELLLRGKASNPALDPTLGNAVALSASEEGFIEHIRQGGFWIYPILILASFSFLAALSKWLQLMSIRQFRPLLVQDIIDALKQGNSDAAILSNQAIMHPASDIISRGIELYSDNSDISRDTLEESLYEKFLESLPSLNKGLQIIAIASATAPLLGLLGTVTGMIETFRLINIFGTGDAKSLASGISEALVTTEFGLIVAIPSLILHALLSRKVKGIKSTMEMTSLAFLNGLGKAPQGN